MATESGQGGGAAPGNEGNGGGGGGGANPAPFEVPQEYTQLVTQKAWKGLPDVLKSYTELEAFRGVPAERLITIPTDFDKMDDAGKGTFRSDVFKRIGYEPPSAPAKPEDYGIQPQKGTPPEYTAAMAKAAHGLGLTKAQLEGLAKAQAEFGTKYETDQHAAFEAGLQAHLATADAKLTAADRELITRAATAEGYDDKTLGTLERELAALDLEATARGEKSDLLGLFRKTLTTNAQLRQEAPLHRGGNGGQGGGARLTPAEATQKLAQLQADPEWGKKALMRGTPEAIENLRLNRMIAGAPVDEEAIKREASGSF